MPTFLKIIITLASFLLFLTACSNQTIKTEKPENKNWQLNTELSTLSFVTTKNKTFAEEHSLKFKQGNLHEQHVFNAIIDLNSIDTLIPIRDQRLRDVLFETKQFPTASIDTLIPRSLDLNINQNITLPFALNLHGIEKSFTTEVVIQMVNNQLVVTNYNPVLISAKDFGLDDAVNQLTKVASLQSINYGVSVDFKLIFEAL